MYVSGSYGQNRRQGLQWGCLRLCSGVLKFYIKFTTQHLQTVTHIATCRQINDKNMKYFPTIQLKFLNELNKKNRVLIIVI